MNTLTRLLHRGFCKLLLLTVLCLCGFASRAQWVTIPDTNFVQYLQDSFPSCMNGNQMDTTCAAIVNKDKIICSHRGIRDLTGVQYFDKATELYCHANVIDHIPAFPSTLISLKADSNELSSIPPLSPNTHTLRIKNNKFAVCPTLPTYLNILECSSNLLTSLPTLPTWLGTLTCNNNQLTVLPLLPSTLGILDCADNQITALPVLPDSLGYLTCEGNQITALPNPLPAGLRTLDCSNNPLGSLPPLPPMLRALTCYNNQLTTLPPLPMYLHLLFASDNQLTGLPPLPPLLFSLYCGRNQLVSLPPLPAWLGELLCDFNQLTSLPELPDSLGVFQCNNNPLQCFPELKKIRHFTWVNTGVSCLPNYPSSNVYSFPDLSTVPLCDIFNSNGCEVIWNIQGAVHNDTNSNCVRDTAELPVRNLKVQLSQNGSVIQQHISSEGFYTFDTDAAGTYDISIATANIPFNITCPAGNQHTAVITATDSFENNLDFGVECKPGFDVGAWSIFTCDTFRSVDFTLLNIHAGDWAQFWGQTCNTAALAGQLTVVINGPVSFSSAAPGAVSPNIISGDTLIYNIADWSVIDVFRHFNIIVQTDTGTVFNQIVCFTVSVTPTSGDNDLSNNALTMCFPIINSYDPNDKQVYPDGDIYSSQEWLTYTVRFQNTGNAEARNIYIDDTLGMHVDLTSFQLLAYSHDPMIQIKENTVRFNFPNINLPDSTNNEPESHGWLQYRIKLKENLAVGTVINTVAGIYFDFNPPVITNTTVNTIVAPPVEPVQQFAPVGAVWHYQREFAFSPNEGYYKIEATGDTIINGKDCRILSLGNSKPGCEPIPTVNYVYEEDSIAYFYNSTLDNFQILYDLTTEEDSTWTTIIMSDDHLDTIVVQVDSAYTQNINGYDLKTLNVSYIPPSHAINTGAYPSTIIERIGDIWYLFVRPVGHLYCDTEFSTGLRCYQDSVLSLYDTGKASSCEYTTVGIVETERALLTIYPNPTTGKIEIKSLPQQIETIQLLDMSGRVAATYTDAQHLSLENMQQGIYFLKITDQKGKEYFGKVVRM